MTPKAALSILLSCGGAGAVAGGCSLVSSGTVYIDESGVEVPPESLPQPSPAASPESGPSGKPTQPPAVPEIPAFTEEQLMHLLSGMFPLILEDLATREGPVLYKIVILPPSEEELSRIFGPDFGSGGDKSTRCDEEDDFQTTESGDLKVPAAEDSGALPASETAEGEVAVPEEGDADRKPDPIVVDGGSGEGDDDDSGDVAETPATPKITDLEEGQTLYIPDEGLKVEREKPVESADPTSTDEAADSEDEVAITLDSVSLEPGESVHDPVSGLTVTREGESRGDEAAPSADEDQSYPEEEAVAVRAVEVDGAELPLPRAQTSSYRPIDQAKRTQLTPEEEEAIPTESISTVETGSTVVPYVEHPKQIRTEADVPAKELSITVEDAPTAE